MNIDFDSLAANIVFKKEYNDFFTFINDLIRDENESKFWKIKRYLNSKDNSIYQFIEEKSSIYWYEVFNCLIDSSIVAEKIIKIFNNDEQKCKRFLDYLISENIYKIFELYENSDEVINDFKKFSDKGTLFCKELKLYFSKNFEKVHNSFGGFLMLIQNIELPNQFFSLYESHPNFSKFFNDYNKIEKDDYLNFRKFWYYLIKYQKIPFKYIFKYVRNFENDKVLKKSINTSNNYVYYWTELEKNKNIFNKLKIFNINDSEKINFNMI